MISGSGHIYFSGIPKQFPFISLTQSRHRVELFIEFKESVAENELEPVQTDAG